MSYMTEFATAEFDGVLNNKFTVCSLDHTGITFLSTHCCIERSLLYKYGTLLSLRERIYDLCFCGKDSNLGIKGKMIVADEFCCYVYIDIIVYGCVCTHIVGYFTGSTCLDSLLFHCLLEAFLVNAVAFLLKNLFCKVKRESVRIIKLECVVTGKGLFTCFFHILFHVGKDAKSLIDSFVELILLICEYTEDELFLLLKLRISGFGALNYLCT